MYLWSDQGIKEFLFFIIKEFILISLTFPNVKFSEKFLKTQI